MRDESALRTALLDSGKRGRRGEKTTRAHLLVVAAVPVPADEGAVVRSGEVEYVARLRVHDLVRPAVLKHDRSLCGSVLSAGSWVM